MQQAASGALSSGTVKKKCTPSMPGLQALVRDLRVAAMGAASISAHYPACR
jgi:hypothetical protein